MDTFYTVEYAILTFLLKAKLVVSLEIFLKIWIILTLNLYDVVSTSVSVWQGRNIRYFTSQIVIDLLDVKEKCKTVKKPQNILIIPTDLKHK